MNSNIGSQGEGEDWLSVARDTVRRVRKVASLPETAQRAERVAADPDSSIEELAEAFAADAALCSHLLKVANSAFFGVRAEVSSIAHASTLLGRKTLRNVAMAASMRAILPRVEVHPSTSVAALWRHSIRTAAIASAAAREFGLWEPEEAFAAGLIHDLGLLVEIQSDRDALSSVFDRFVGDGRDTRRPDLIRVLERNAFGADHQHFGQALCEAWHFPASLCEAAGFHHEPLGASEEHRTLAALVHLAEACGAGFEHGTESEPEARSIAPAVLEWLGLDAERVEAARAGFLAQAQAAEEAFRTMAAAA